MRLLFDVLHPAHVHFFRHLAETALAEGGDVLFTAREKDVTLELLRAYDLPHEVLTGIGGGAVGLAREMVVRTLKLTRRVRRFRPDLMLGIMGPVIAPVGRATGVPSWVYYDTETATATNRFVYPLCSRLFLPESYRGPAPKKAVRYPGYHELAYLHPSRFTADATVRQEAGLGPDEPFAVVRLVSWEASHDVGDTGFANPVRFVNELKQRIRVVITGERGVPPELREHAMTVPPHRIHHLLAEASLYVGEGATMAAEAAILGTPAVFMHTARLGYMLELEERFGLLWNTASQQVAEQRAMEIVADLPAAAAAWAQKRAAMLEAKMDVGAWMVEQVRGAVGG
jgi:predicted glycosyltransferase